MNVATILFTYNRSAHTEKVLKALQESTILPQKLYIFQDGLKEEGHRAEWEKVSSLIQKVDFCPTEVCISENNKGLAESIVSGINYVFAENDAVIVLEDDCVPMRGFIQFMTQCFVTYEKDKRVYSVSGYAWPVSLESAVYDAYFCGRMSSWGWGTWKDRWNKYEKDYEILQRIKRTSAGSRQLAMWGNDLELQLTQRLKGDNDSWAVFWALKVIENKGLCVNPYVSLIDNIGHDNSGVHCVESNKFEVALDVNVKTSYNLPLAYSDNDGSERAFVTLWGNYTALTSDPNIKKEKILVYGLGNFFILNEKAINEQYEIMAFVDRHKRGYYAGKEIIKADQIDRYTYDRIYIAIQSMQESLNISKLLCEKYGVSPNRIILGRGGAHKDVGINVDLNGGMTALFGERTYIQINSEDEFNNCLEVWRDNIYSYNLCNERQDVVIDVGMNIGDSVLWFLQKENVRKVYAYEPFENTYRRAEKNIYSNKMDEQRYELFPVGLSNVSEKRSVRFNEDMSCGQSTDIDIRTQNYQNYVRWGLINEENEIETKIEVKRASKEINRIIEKHKDCNIILKIDCEGEEYAVFEDLSDAGVLEKIDLIMLEWHYRGADRLLNKMRMAGFSCWNFNKNETMGCIYAFRQCDRA